MPRNFEFSHNVETGKPFSLWYLNGKSTTINAGEPVVLTTAAALTTASNPVVRTLLAADVTAQYKESTPIAGVLGIAMMTAVTTSGGVATTQPSITGVSAAGQPVYRIPNIGAGIDADTNIGYTRIRVALAHPNNVFKGKLGGGGTTTASNVLVGTLAGIDINTGVFTVDTSETYKPLRILGWDPSDTTRVYFQFLESYSQFLTGVNYSSQ